MCSDQLQNELIQYRNKVAMLQEQVKMLERMLSEENAMRYQAYKRIAELTSSEKG